MIFSTDKNSDNKINLICEEEAKADENIEFIDTPIYDFVLKYSKSDSTRFHMPGHKGVSRIGCEPFDITEIEGADVLYGNCNEKGIIQKSMENAAKLFGTKKTFYSTEGSSHCIRAMLGAVNACRKINNSSKTLILAARNVHKSFVYAVAALDLEVEWIYPKEFTHLCSCLITAEDVKREIQTINEKYGKNPDAVYVTSPDYMGNIADIEGISQICHQNNILLLVDNAHGAYLAFMEKYSHPIHAGADICCDSAHKTLPVLTGGAYLHFSTDCDEKYISSAENMLRVFGSTSPSYIIMASLDLCNKYLKEEFPQKIAYTLEKVIETKKQLKEFGLSLNDTEPLKFVINAAKSGINGNLLADTLVKNNIFPEMYDEDYVVLMVTTENKDEDYDRLLSVSAAAIKNAKASYDCKCLKSYKDIYDATILEEFRPRDCKMSIRDAVFSMSEIIPTEKSLGKICAAPVVICPPAIPVVISGEVITSKDISIMKKYGIDEIAIVACT